MSLDPRAKRLLEMLRATGPSDPATLSLEARRASFNTLMRLSSTGAASGCRVENRTVAGRDGLIRLRLFSPPTGESRALPALVYFHGGGLVAGSLDTHEPLCAALALASHCRIVSVDYRLAPEHKFPAALSDAWDATLWVYKHAAEVGIDRDRIGVAGDSAGATLAALVCQEARSSDELTLRLQVLMCPIADFVARMPSRQEFASGYLVDEALLARDLADYLPTGVSGSDSRVSPLRAVNFGGLAAAVIHTAQYDPLRDEGAAYARALESAGVPVQHVCHPGMIHLFFALGAVFPNAASAIELIGSHISAGLGECADDCARGGRPGN